MSPLALETMAQQAEATTPRAAVILTLTLSTGNEVRHRVRYDGDLQFLASSWQRLISEAEGAVLWDEAGRYESVTCAQVVRLAIEGAVTPRGASPATPVSSWFYASRPGSESADTA